LNLNQPGRWYLGGSDCCGKWLGLEFAQSFFESMLCALCKYSLGSLAWKTVLGWLFNPRVLKKRELKTTGAMHLLKRRKKRKKREASKLCHCAMRGNAPPRVDQRIICFFF